MQLAKFTQSLNYLKGKNHCVTFWHTIEVFLYTNFDWYHHHFHVLNLHCQDPVPEVP